MTTTTKLPQPVDVCPLCTTTPIELALHGATAGMIDDFGASWRCTRCGLLAVDLANAAEYAEMLSTAGLPDRVVGRLLRDAEDGRPVDPMQLARATGRAWAPLGERRLLAELAWTIATDIEPRSPWSTAPTATVAEMIAAALHAAWLDIVDVLDGFDVPEVPDLDAEGRRSLAAKAAELTADGGTEYAAAIGQLHAFGYQHATRDDAAVSVLAAVVDELRDDAHRLGTFDDEVSAAIRTALAAAGFALVIRDAS